MRGGRGMRPGYGAGFARGGRGRGRWFMGRGRCRWYPYALGIPYGGWRPYPYGPMPVPYYGVPIHPYPY